MALTDTRLRTLRPQKGKDERLVADGNGLYIRVRAARGQFTRTWQFRRKEKGRPSITTLGTYPELSIKEARLKAAELATKRKQYSPTVQEAVEQWLAERVDHTHRKADQVRGYVDRAIIPDLGSTRVRDVEPTDIARVIRSYRDRVAKLPRSRTGGAPCGAGPAGGVQGALRLCCGQRLDFEFTRSAAHGCCSWTAAAVPLTRAHGRRNPLRDDHGHQARPSPAFPAAHRASPGRGL